MHRHTVMPRKQRFKPSRKPQPPQQPAGETIDERREVHPDDVEIERDSSSRAGQGADIEGDGSDRSR